MERDNGTIGKDWKRMEIKTNRIAWLDTGRGIVILFMILGHSSMPDVCSRWIWSFHMPFFFITSGLMMRLKGDRHKPFNNFLLHEMKSLLWPFFTCSILVLLLSFVYQPNWIFYIKKVFVNGWGGLALWFVPVLFMAKLLCYLLIQRGKYQYIGVILVIIIGCILSYYHVFLPYNLSSSFYATFFVYFGYKLGSYKFKGSDGTVFIYASMLLVVGFLLSFAGRLDMCTNKILPIIPISISALMGTMAILCFSFLLDRKDINNSWLKLCGCNTFLLMAFSQPIMKILISFFEKTFVGSLFLSSILRYILLFLSLYVIIIVVNKRMKWLLKIDKLIVR